MRKRSGGKRALGTRAPMAVPSAPNECWSLEDLCLTASPTSAASACWPSSSTACGNAWRFSRTPHYRAGVWHASWIASSSSAASPSHAVPITAPNSPAWRPSSGKNTAMSTVTTSSRASRNRTVLPRASLVGFAISASTKRCSHRSMKLAPCSPHGGRTTTACVPIRHLPTGRRTSSGEIRQPLPQAS